MDTIDMRGGRDVAHVVLKRVCKCSDGIRKKKRKLRSHFFLSDSLTILNDSRNLKHLKFFIG